MEENSKESGESDLDDDLLTMSQTDLILEIKKLRTIIREHRDSSGHDLCWYWPEMWSLLPEEKNVKREVPCKEEFLLMCGRYRDSLDE